PSSLPTNLKLRTWECQVESGVLSPRPSSYDGEGPIGRLSDCRTLSFPSTHHPGCTPAPEGDRPSQPRDFELLESRSPTLIQDKVLAAFHGVLGSRGPFAAMDFEDHKGKSHY